MMSNRKSIRIRRILVVAQKEIVDFVRDWRTILAMVLIPILIFPVIFIALPLFLQGEATEIQETPLHIQLQTEVSENPPGELLARFSESNLLWTESALDNGTELPIPGDDGQLLTSGIENGTLHAILRMRSTNTNASESWNYSVIYDSTNELSRAAANRVFDSIISWEGDVINATLAAHDLSRQEVFDPIHREGDAADSNIATEGEVSAMTLAMFIPLVVALWTATAGIQPAIDLTAGERERGTMEALLSTPVARSDLLMGKWLAVAAVACVSVIAQLGGLLFAISFLAAGAMATPSISTVDALLLLLSVLLFAVFTVAIEIAVAVRAHSVKEAGATLGPLILIFIGPTMFAQFVNLEGIESWWFALPVFNVTLAMREALMGIHEPTHIVIWVVTCLAYAIGAVLWASRQFNREDLVVSIS
jgi:sodium transport system permease protein